jgi:hypothetical protein
VSILCDMLTLICFGATSHNCLAFFRLKYDMSNCAFSEIMSDMATIPFFGTSFSVYAPLLIVLVCALTLFDCYPKLLHWLGIEHEDALLLGDEEDLESKVNEGIQLMTRDAERRGIGGSQNSSLEELSLKQSTSNHSNQIV